MYSKKPDDSSKQACKRQCIIGAAPMKKKTVSFSNEVKLRRTTFDDSYEEGHYSSWFTHEEIASMKKRAKNLAALHYLKTRPGQKAPSIHSGIVYNCHPAQYEIIGESLRGMEHITDSSKAHSRNRLRSCTISLIREHHDQKNAFRDFELAYKYAEYSEEAMAYSIQIAEEDARMAEDMHQDDDDAFSMLSESPLCTITDLPEMSRLSSSPAAA